MFVTMDSIRRSSWGAVANLHDYILISRASFNVLHKMLKLNSVVLVRKRTIPSERPQPAGEVSANFSW
jgi:hypothetical protein